MSEYYKHPAPPALRSHNIDSNDLLTAVKTYYQRLIDDGVRPELARVSVARKLASIALAVWQRREEFDARKTFAQT
jgi:hypothetical protein